MNLPADFESYTRRLLGAETYACLTEALQQEPPVSVRINQSKCAAYEVGNPLPAPAAAPVSWCASGFYLNERPSFTFDPLFHAGCYYVQEASSMFLEQALRTYVQQPVVMLDLCAAPGGKSTHARSVLPKGSLLVANEVIRNRAQILAENLIKWGEPEVIVTRNEPADFANLPSLFDVILTDVPCSGEGMFRKDEGAISEWSTENVHRCGERQRTILSDVWSALKPSGLLIYSTCTYNTLENEENVAWLRNEFGAEVLPVPTDPAWGITGNLWEEELPVYRFLPHLTKGEGFFMAVLRKPEESLSNNRRSLASGKKEKGKKASGRNPHAITAEHKCLLQQPETYVWNIEEERVTAFPLAHEEVYRLLCRYLTVIHAGVTVGEWKGKDFIPHHSLSMCRDIHKEAFAQKELTYEQAIAYLRKETFTWDNDAPRGYLLFTYKGVPMGFVKNIGSRFNNLYPQEWRIRSVLPR